MSSETPLIRPIRTGGEVCRKVYSKGFVFCDVFDERPEGKESSDECCANMEVRGPSQLNRIRHFLALQLLVEYQLDWAAGCAFQRVAVAMALHSLPSAG